MYLATTATTTTTTTTTTTADPCPCTDELINSINYGYTPYLLKNGQIKLKAAGTDVFAYSISQTIFNGDEKGMEAEYDGYLLMRKYGSCNSNVLEKFMTAKWWFTDVKCSNCYTSKSGYYFKQDVANKRKTFTLGYQ